MKNIVYGLATVTRLNEIPNNENNVYYAPIITFVDNQGKTQTIRSSTASNPPRYQVNQRVEIIYEPRSPEKAVINNFYNIWFTSTMCAIAGLFLVLMGIIAELIV